MEVSGDEDVGSEDRDDLEVMRGDHPAVSLRGEILRAEWPRYNHFHAFVRVGVYLRLDVMPSRDPIGEKLARAPCISEENLETAWEKSARKIDFLDTKIDPTKQLAADAALQGAHLKAAAGEGLGGMFGFSKDFGVGGLNPASPLQPGAPAGLTPLTSMPPLGR